MKKLALVAASAAAFALVGCDSMGGSGYSESDAAIGAAFRHHARDVVAGLAPQCPFSVNPDVLTAYDGVGARFEALKESIAGRSLVVDLAVVEADYEHYWSVNQVECAEPDGEGTAEQITQEVAAIDAQLQQLERIVGGI